MEAVVAPSGADLQLLAAFARDAPTPDERRNARDQLRSFEETERRSGGR